MIAAVTGPWVALWTLTVLIAAVCVVARYWPDLKQHEKEK